MKEFLSKWLAGDPCDVGDKRHLLWLLDERADVREEHLDAIASCVNSHYIDSETTADRIAALGADMTADLLREELPQSKKARSGDFGEILATEIAEELLGWKVPIRRLRWKDGREMALRGDDLIGIKVKKNGKFEFLKAEAKSRAGSASTAIKDAQEALDANSGRPTSHTVLWIGKRLRDKGKKELALKLDRQVANSFSGSRIEHYLFVLSGKNPTKLLEDHHGEIQSKKRHCNIVGAYIADHADFINGVYEAM